eukprot:TRINITY_DN7793_c0_g1_i1.p1 TRINITY_DN7793_c0_g1~~TRINITY_DN7793_c0_g1_i1.p1  ORF type:complete len:470 (-),score=149.45 TRINITY_DN7793_c0_g1_i1:65-1474(-)
MANIRTLNDMRGGSGAGGSGGRGPPGGFPSAGGSDSHASEKRVKIMRSEQQINQEFSAADGKLVVIDFSASWCGPCRAIAPVFADLSERHPDVVFLKVDVDELSSFAQNNGVRAMPTFIFFKNRQKVAELQGANPQKLQDLIAEHGTLSASSSLGGGGGGGYTLGGTPGASNANDNNQLASSEAAKSAKQSIRTELLEMGFDQTIIDEAERATSFDSLQTAVEWIFMKQSEGEGSGSDGQSLGGQPRAGALTQDSSVGGPEVEAESATKKELTPEELERQKILLDQKLKDLRIKKQKEEEEREHNREIMRRKTGKETQDSIRKWEEDKAEREARALKKEKELEKQYKEAARRKVEQNKINRMKKEGKEEEAMVIDKPVPPPQQKATTSSQTESLLQIKLPNGTTTQSTFKTTDSLQAVADHVSGLLGVPSSRITLSTTYPRKSFAPSEFGALLVDVGLFPRGQVVVKTQ